LRERAAGKQEDKECGDPSFRVIHCESDVHLSSQISYKVRCARCEHTAGYEPISKLTPCARGKSVP
jgi:hypothetical protein